jgi:Predicted hydrolases or acyltransferases (alpha/beta hydrolase superfamily)
MTGYLHRSHLDGITDALRASAPVRAAGRWFDGVIGLACGRDRISVRVADGAVVSVQAGRGVRGPVIDISSDEAGWDRIVNGRARDFSRLLYTGVLRVSGDRMEFGRSVLLVAEMLAALRAYYRAEPSPPSVLATTGRSCGEPEPDDDTPITGTYTDVGGLRMYAERCGTGRPVVLVHTAGLDGRQWRYVMRRLAQRGYQAIAVDLPGHGRSDMPSGGPLREMSALADAVGDFAEYAGLADYAVVGCSVGGDVSLTLALRRPQRVTALVACAASAYTPSASRLFLELSQDSAGAAGWNDMFRLNCLACTGDAIPDDRLDQLMWAHATANHLVGTADLLAWHGHDIRDRLHEITCPALLIHGSYDFFVDRDEVVRTAEGIARGQFLELPDVGHYPMVEDVELGDRIADFLD